MDAGWWLTYPSEKYDLSQLGWWHSQYMEKSKSCFQTTNQDGVAKSQNLSGIARNIPHNYLKKTKPVQIESQSPNLWCLCTFGKQNKTTHEQSQASWTNFWLNCAIQLYRKNEDPSPLQAKKELQQVTRQLWKHHPPHVRSFQSGSPPWKKNTITNITVIALHSYSWLTIWFERWVSPSMSIPSISVLCGQKCKVNQLDSKGRRKPLENLSLQSQAPADCLGSALQHGQVASSMIPSNLEICFHW